jgi:hypothetical protein
MGLDQPSWLRVDHVRSLPAVRLRDTFGEGTATSWSRLGELRGVVGPVGTGVASPPPVTDGRDCGRPSTRIRWPFCRCEANAACGLATLMRNHSVVSCHSPAAFVRT